jgi:hypothetical protein
VKVLLGVLALLLPAAVSADDACQGSPADGHSGILDSYIVTTQMLSSGSTERCDPARRDSMEMPPPQCCTASMLAELRAMREPAIARLERALRALDSPGDHADRLRRHFRVSPSDGARTARIRARLQEMLDSIRDPQAVQVYCRDRFDKTCMNGLRRAATFNCSSSRPPMMMFCANYDGRRYFDGDGWLRTFMHEHAHAGCRRVGDISSAGHASYNHPGATNYPPPADEAVRNADSLASFAHEFSN